jgi:hypothetical protein
MTSERARISRKTQKGSGGTKSSRPNAPPRARPRPRPGRAASTAQSAQSAQSSRSVLGSLKPEESAAVLHALLGRHRALRREAERIALAQVEAVRPGKVADAVERAVLGVDPEQLAARSGRKRWGYVEPNEAAARLLEEALDPFLADMKRLVALGLEDAAVATCAGIVQGLYAVRDREVDDVVAYAMDFPAETAWYAVATLARESMKVHRRRWTLPDGIAASVPEWKAMLQRTARGE